MTAGVYEDNLLCGPWFDSTFLNTCCKATRTADPPVDADLVAELIMVSCEAMYYWLGRQFRGECTTVFRPKVCACGGYWGWGSGRAYSTEGVESSGGGTSNEHCSCGHVAQIDLGFFPVTSINSIWMNGAAQPIGNYHLDEYRYLVANDGACFPIVQNYSSVPGDSNDKGPDRWVFEVSIDYGQPVPPLAKRAAARLACELIKDCMELPCALPDRTVNVVRQGVSQQIVSAQDMIAAGLIGILEIDLALKAYNPAKLQSPSFIWSPDLRQGGRRTHT